MMKSYRLRIGLPLLAFAFALMPVYAHHGTQFLTKAMEMNTAEVQLGEMAANKAQDARVKEFAQMVARDHGQALEKVKQLLAARNEKNMNVQITPEHKRTADRLMALSGADFDREFMATMVTNHQNGIKTFEAQSHVHGNTGKATKQSSNTTTQEARQKPNTGDQKYSKNDMRRDVDTVDFVNATLPVMRHHLEEAQRIQRDLNQGKAAPK